MWFMYKWYDCIYNVNKHCFQGFSTTPIKTRRIRGRWDLVFPRGGGERQFSKILPSRGPKVEWMDHASDYSAGLHSAGLSPLTSKHPWCSICPSLRMGRESENFVWRELWPGKVLLTGQSRTNHLRIFPRVRTAGANSHGDTVFGARFVGTWRKDTNDTFRTKASSEWNRTTIGGAHVLSPSSRPSVEGWPQ